MDANTNIDALRRKHKKMLVDRAMGLYQPTDDTPAVKEEWVSFLLKGNAAEEMIQRLKTNEVPGGNLPTKQLTQSKNNNLTYLGTTTLAKPLEKLRSGIPVNIEVNITNHGNTLWQNNSSNSINASYHWLNENGSPFLYDGVRTPLPNAIAPGETLPLTLKVVPPSHSGSYQLQLTLVHEGVCWFEERGFTPTTYPIYIEWCLPASTTRVLEEFAYGQDVWAKQEAVA
ncbi:hypothetical protein [Vreelandella aquamarina]|uniref:hypothetical protein n=1 Tax=Vreelandella aquamarina TaxID=77097 RepID=UPI003D084CA6